MITYASARARYARAVKGHQPAEILAAFKRDERAAWLGHQITTTAPELTDSQRGQLALILLKGGADAG